MWIITWLLETWGWLNAQTWILFQAGLVLIALYQVLKWQDDRNLAGRLIARGQPDIPLEQFPRVSILVAAWNETEFLERHIKSILALRYPNKEYVLCAGGNDHTLKIARQFAWEGMIVLEQQPGEGKQRALQRCFEASNGEVIFLTDADCLIDDIAFEGTLAPVISEGELVSTGDSQPIEIQRNQPFVLQRWFMDLYDQAHWKTYVEGILGRNVAVRREVLQSIGAFQTIVRSGTDYMLAKQLRMKGYRIRHADSWIMTDYPTNVSSYYRRQSRWLRNVVVHGLRFRVYREVFNGLLPSLIGWGVWIGSLFALWQSGFWGVILCLFLTYALSNRIRYICFGLLLSKQPFPFWGWLGLPIYLFVDLLVWTLTLPQYSRGAWREQW